MPAGAQATGDHVHPDVLRSEFSAALSAMYREEVPLYGDLVQLVDEVNEGAGVQGSWQIADRLRVERHGAIRLGRPDELAMIARLFRQMGMFPVGYYDLSTSGVPVHATAFRPVRPESLALNPFRVFTSLLRLELVPDPELRDQMSLILSQRDIFHPSVRQLVLKGEEQGGLGRADADALVVHALETFRWHEEALVSEDVYRRMSRVHPLLADIAGFKGPHINHLTPRVLDIDKAQAGMAERGITPKRIIEGPPRRACPILLRQTSFQALTEPIRFLGSATGTGVAGSHRARFGEIESRGCALTRRGHDKYLSLMADMDRGEGPSPLTDDNDTYQARLQQTFSSYPDTWEALRSDRLAYFTYSVKETAPIPRGLSLDVLVKEGSVVPTPIVYEDFLPASAAGIFRSNLQQPASEDAPAVELVGGNEERQGTAKRSFESALGGGVVDMWQLYEAMERVSLDEVVRRTGCVGAPADS